MSVVSVNARSFILALFIRDDGERFLLGDKGFDFKDSQLHFSANTIENDEVEKQGVDGVMLAGQVRRASVQSFDGYVGDGTTLKEEVEQMRRDFIAFFAKGHHFRVVYIDCNRNAWQRKGGYLVDAPEVKELWQIHPEYHVGLNFEDVNYYEYDENADGQEILANIMKLPISSDVEGGLVWDEDGAVSEDATVVYDGDTATASGTSITVSDAVEAPLKSLELQGNTTQQTYSGKNLFDAYKITTVGGSVVKTVDSDGIIYLSNNSYNNGYYNPNITLAAFAPKLVADQTYYIYVSNSFQSGGRNYIYLSGSSSYWNTGEAHTVTQAELNGGVVVYGGYQETSSLKIMITTTADTNWEKFVGGVPAPNPDYPQAVQTVTGENVVRITGKNLFDKATATQNYRLGSDGLPFGDNEYYLSDYIYAKPNTAYYVSGVSGLPASSAVCFYDSDKSFISRRIWNDWYSFTTPANTAYIRFTTQKTNDINGVQLELGSTATAYEPYQGQSYEVNLGKNLAKMANGAYSYSEAGQTFTLLDGSITTTRTDGSYQGGAINISTGALNRWTKFCASDSHLTGSGGTYTLTFSRTGDVVTSSSPRACIYGFIYDNDGNNTSGNGQLLVDLSSQTSGTYTLNLAADRHLGALVFYSQYISYSDVEFKVQLEKGSTPTSYAAYFEPIELCKIGTYQDYIYKSGDKWYVQKAVGKLNCSDYTWSWDSSIPRVSLSTAGMRVVPPGGNQYPFLAYSNKFKADTFTHVYTEKNNGMAFSTSGFISLVDTSWTSEAEANSDIQDAVIYYALQIAYRTDIEITNEALIAQLEAILSQGYTYAGTNNITTAIATGNEQGELEITYYTKYDAKVVSGGYVWEAGGSGGPTVVINESISAVSPVWTVFGPALNPMLENTTTGEQIQYVGLIGEGQTLVVDMGEQTARLDGLNVISNIVGDYLTLAPGSNTLLFSAEGDAPASEIGWSEIVG